MKKGISLMSWVDMTDLHEYQANETFPYDGREIPDERIEEIKNAGFIRVEEVEEPKKKAK